VYLDGTFIEAFQLGDMIQLANLVPGQAYVFGASYVYDDGESIHTEFEFTFLPNAVCNPPQNPVVSPLGLMSWDPPAPGSSSQLLNYNVFLDGVLVGSPTAPPWQFTGITPGQTYLAEISAVYEDGESDLVEATWEQIIHDPPVNAGYEVYVDHIHLYWEEPNQYVEEYHVYVEGNLFITSELFFDIYDLIPGQIYELALTAFYIDQIESDPIIFNIAFVEGGDILNAAASLWGNFPNPFNPTTVISFSLLPEKAEKASLTIYNLEGQIIKCFGYADFRQSVGLANHLSVVWNGKDSSGKAVASGVYLYQLKAADFVKTKKMILMK
jgi:hypothetical protein